ncbi:MAG: tRNA (adenosine(37)-N6)-threonylcarbamoyltransferase complex dimerization subunit type 1 TsaB, partial [Planctomycetes bacterium]|nr:tRNA (adenosine(37)-N6)-threonylcarbamoyltransferase complex dimerization subunit type 1 TsaB [Planctomycetota bacterium]
MDTPKDPEGSFEIALETSTRRASLAIGFGDSVALHHLSDGVAHASDLLPLLTAGLEKLGLERERLARVHVGIGPGSFTGLRVGAAIALGLHGGLGVPLCAVPSVAATAWAHLEEGERGTVVIDAR